MIARNTNQQNEIRRVLEEAGRPLCPNEILEAARVEIPRLGPATVYRGILKLLEENSIHRVQLPGRPDRYEWAGGEHHHHFFCRTCEKLFDVDGCMGGIEKLAPRGFQAESHDLLIRGLCPSCRGKES